MPPTTPKAITTTEAVEDPVTLAEAKLHARIEIDDDNALVSGLIKSATQWVENYTRRCLVTRTRTLYLDDFDGDSIEIPDSPVAAVVSVKYLDTAGVEQTYTSSNYTTDLITTPAVLALRDGSSWPATKAEPNAVRVQYIAGYGAAAAVPAIAKEAIKQFVAYAYDERAAAPLTAAPEWQRAWLKQLQNLLEPIRIVDFF